MWTIRRGFRVPYMSYLAVIAVAFALTLLGELPDKSMFASLVLGPATGLPGCGLVPQQRSRFMAIAVTPGQLLALLPHRGAQAVVAVLFVTGSAYLWVTSFRPDNHEGADASRQGGQALCRSCEWQT